MNKIVFIIVSLIFAHFLLTAAGSFIMWELHFFDWPEWNEFARAFYIIVMMFWAVGSVVVAQNI